MSIWINMSCSESSWLLKVEKKPPQPQKESKKVAPILLDTPEKPKQQFEVIVEDEEDSISLDLPQSLGL